jgi:hypothetical protein
MSYGLGFIADGLLKGQERNRNWGLRQRQEERAQTTFGLQVPVLEAKAQEAKEYVTPDAIERRNTIAGNNLAISSNNAESSGYDRDLKKNDASTDNIARINREREAKALGAESLAKGYGLGNAIKQQQIDMTNLGPLSKEGRDLLYNKNKYDLEAQAWEHKMREAVNQTDKLKAMMALSEVKLNREFRVIELARSGNTKAAASLINGFSDNPYKNVVDAVFTKEGGITGYNEKGEIVAEYTPKEVAGIELEIRNKEAKAREAKAGTPKVNFEKIYNDLGEQIGERPFITKTDPQTGQPYKEYVEERKGTISQTDSDEEIALAKTMVKAGEMTPDQFQQLYGQAYAPNQNNASPSASNKPRQDDYDVDIPLIF